VPRRLKSPDGGGGAAGRAKRTLRGRGGRAKSVACQLSCHLTTTSTGGPGSDAGSGSTHSGSHIYLPGPAGATLAVLWHTRIAAGRFTVVRIRRLASKAPSLF